MAIYVVSVCHMQPQIMAYSLMQGLMTINNENLGPSLPVQLVWVLVDNHWPMQKEMVSGAIEAHLAPMVKAFTIKPHKNLGGHGGFNYAVQALAGKYDLEDDDLILCYDPDSNPTTPNWLKPLVEVMQADPEFDFLSLMPSQCVQNRNWLIRTIAGHAVATDSNPEMINVTLFRYRCVRRTLTADSTFYGNIESSMWNRGFKSGYLFEFLEHPCPIPHPQAYVRWKLDHACGRYPGNFDQYVKEVK